MDRPPWFVEALKHQNGLTVLRVESLVIDSSFVHSPFGVRRYTFGLLVEGITQLKNQLFMFQ
jgi:hypothetical protein